MTWSPITTPGRGSFANGPRCRGLRGGQDIGHPDARDFGQMGGAPGRVGREAHRAQPGHVCKLVNDALDAAIQLIRGAVPRCDERLDVEHGGLRR